MSRGLASVAAGLTWSVCVDVAPAQPPEMPPDLIKRIEAAWERRDAAFSTFDCQWREETLHPAGSKGRDEAMQLKPVEDTTVRRKFRFVCDDEKVRIEKRGVQYNPAEDGFSSCDWLEVYDGRERRETIFSASATQPTGYISEDGNVAGQFEWDTNPITLAMRPVSLHMGAVLFSTAKSAERTEQVGKIDCHVVLIPTNGLQQALFVATSPDHRIIRQDLLVENVLRSRLTLEYADDPRWSFICTGWTQSEYHSNGKIDCSRVTRDFKLVVNVRVDTAEFRLEFPPFSPVFYSRGKNRDVVRAVVRADGTFRPLTEEDLKSNTTWKEKAQTEPPEGTPPFPTVNRIPLDEPLEQP